MKLHEQIRDALGKLDRNDNSIWTSQGAVKVEIVSSMVGQQLTRHDIVTAAPNFRRDSQTKEEQVAVERERVVQRDDRLKTIAAEIKQHEDDLQLVREELLEVQRAANDIQSKLDALIVEREKLAPKQSFQQAQQAAAQRSLEERKRRAKELQEKGLPASLGLSPLDQALASRGRKNFGGFGR